MNLVQFGGLFFFFSFFFFFFFSSFFFNKNFVRLCYQKKDHTVNFAPESVTF